jgi:hypothetical protein
MRLRTGARPAHAFVFTTPLPRLAFARWLRFYVPHIQRPKAIRPVATQKPMASFLRVCVKTACYAFSTNLKALVQRKGTAYSVPNPITHKHLPPLLQWTERAVPFRWNEPLGVYPVCRPFSHDTLLRAVPLRETPPLVPDRDRDGFVFTARSWEVCVTGREARWLRFYARRPRPEIPYFQF